MEDGQIMVVLIVAIVMIASIMKAKIRAEAGGNPKCSKKRRRNRPIERDERDTVLLKMNEQLDRITERLAVLETIVTDEDRELKKEFQSLKSDISKSRQTLDSRTLLGT